MKTRRIKLKEKYSRKHKGGMDPLIVVPAAAAAGGVDPLAPPLLGPDGQPLPPAPPGGVDPLEPPASEDITEFIKVIRKDIVEKIKLYTPAQRETFKNRIGLAITNAKNGVSSNTTRKKSNSEPEPESNKIELEPESGEIDPKKIKSMKFKDIKNLFMRNIDRKKIKNSQYTFISYLIDYYYSNTGFTGRLKIEYLNGELFTDTQIEYLSDLLETYRNNDKFTNVFIEVLKYITQNFKKPELPAAGPAAGPVAGPE